MPWIPETPLLGTYAQQTTFSNSVQYYEETVGAGSTDPTTGEVTPGEVIRTYYPVRIVANEVNPATITISSDDYDTATISGYYGPVFNDIVEYLEVDRDLITIDTMNTEPVGVGVWDKLNTSDYWEMVSFTPDRTRYRKFTYTATAGPISGGIQSVIATTIFEIDLSDQNWTPGKEALQNAVQNIRK